MNVRIIAPDADLLANVLPARAEVVHLGLQKAVKRHAMLLQTRIMGKASGRPGPRAPTGDYRRSWNFEVWEAAGEVVATVGTNKPQGRRLEFGFVGADSLGRVYNQPPYPHVRPAVDEIEPMFMAAVAALVEGAL